MLHTVLTEVHTVHLVRQSCAELTRSELDLAILGQLLAFTNSSPGVVTASRHVSEAQYFLLPPRQTGVREDVLDVAQYR